MILVDPYQICVSSRLVFSPNLYGLEHELSVVEGSQVFGDVKTHWADGGEEVKHHRDDLDTTKAHHKRWNVKNCWIYFTYLFRKEPIKKWLERGGHSDWGHNTKTDRNNFKLDLLKMDWRDSRLEISAIQLHCKMTNLHPRSWKRVDIVAFPSPTCISPVSPAAAGLAASVAASLTLSLLQWSSTSTTYSGSESVLAWRVTSTLVTVTCKRIRTSDPATPTHLNIRLLAKVYHYPPAKVSVFVFHLQECKKGRYIRL